MATVFTNAGKAWLVTKIRETAQTPGNYIAWGSGAGTAAIADTTLFTEESEARVAGTESTTTTTVTNDTYTVVGTMTAAAGKTITNAGTFTASSAGTLVVKGDFTGIVLATGDSIAFTINLKIG